MGLYVSSLFVELNKNLEFDVQLLFWNLNLKKNMKESKKVDTFYMDTFYVRHIILL